ncbi:MAG TPA: hypothetical protein VEG38_11830 [Acidimicrobiia bacterium]|nr:hypothetical protein [Acidimicrobiia bacterium]
MGIVGGGDDMVAVEQPRADCGHAAALTQQCGRCLRWCCPECYVPWTALACGECRAEAATVRATTSRSAAIPAFEVPTIEVAVEPSTAARCGERSRSRRATRRHREREREREPAEPADVDGLAARVADLERRLSELRFGS